MRRFASILLAGVFLVAACGGDPRGRTDADDVAFYRAFRSESSLSTEHYARLDQAVKAAGAVVVAQVVDVRHTRTFRGEVAAYPLEMVGVDLRPIEVVAGTLPAEFANGVTVEFVGGSSGTAEAVAELRKSLPNGSSLWFIRHKTDGPGAATDPAVRAGDRPFHRLISPQGLFVQGRSAVESPLADEGSADMAAEGRRFTKLNALVSHVRALR